MFCKNCGNEVNDGSVFCNKCGNKLDSSKKMESGDKLRHTRELYLADFVIVVLSVVVLFTPEFFKSHYFNYTDNISYNHPDNFFEGILWTHDNFTIILGWGFAFLLFLSFIIVGLRFFFYSKTQKWNLDKKVTFLAVVELGLLLIVDFAGGYGGSEYGASFRIWEGFTFYFELVLLTCSVLVRCLLWKHKRDSNQGM